MKEDLLIEQLTRIKEMMGTKSKNLLLERPDNLMPGQIDNPYNPDYQKYEGSKEKTMFGINDENLSTFKIGKGTDYPFIFYFGNENFDTLDVVEGTKVYKINESTTTKEIFGDSILIRTADITDVDGNVHKNQQYIMVPNSSEEKDQMGMKTHRKACLPDDDFWKGVYNGKVYKFETPVRSEGGFFETIKDGKVVFSLYMDLAETPNIEGLGTVEAVEAAINCRGGDNGWGFMLQPPLFFTKAGNEIVGYNPLNPRHLDKRSDWDVWYDHYGMWLEIGIGIAAAFTGIGIANLLTRLGTAAEWSGALWSALRVPATTSYLGGNTTLLSVFCQVLTEGVMMSPILTWQIEDGRDADAGLTVLFCLIPFLTESPLISKYISGKYSKQVAKDLTEKFKKSNLTVLFQLARDGDKAAAKRIMEFLDSLTANELALFNDALKIGSKEEGITAIKQAFEELATSNTYGRFVVEHQEMLLKSKVYKQTYLAKFTKIFGKEGWEISAGKFSKWAGKNINPITAKWTIPHQFGRIGVPLVIFAMSYKLAYTYLTEEEQEEFNLTINEAVYLESAKQLYIDLQNYREGLYQQALNAAVAETTSDEMATTQIVLGDKELVNMAINQQAEKILYNDQLPLTPEECNKYIILLRNLKESIEKTEANKFAIKTLFEGLGFVEIKFNPIKNNDDVSGTLKFKENQYNFRVIRKGDKAYSYVNNRLITDSEIKNATILINKKNEEEFLKSTTASAETENNITNVFSTDALLSKEKSNLEKEPQSTTKLTNTKKYCKYSRKGIWIETDEETYNLITNNNEKCVREYSECSSCGTPENKLYKYCVKKDINDPNSWVNVTKQEYDNEKYLATKCIKSGVDLNTNCKTCQIQPKINECKNKFKNKKILRPQFIECKKRSNLKVWFN